MGNLGSKAPGPGRVKGNKKKQRKNVCSKHICVLCEKGGPALDDHLRGIGNDLFRSGRYEEALEIYSAIIEHNGSNPLAYTNRANTLMRMKRFSEALADCRKGLSLSSESLKANYYMGQCLCEVKDFDQGFMYLKKALVISRREGGKHEWEVQKTISRWQQERRASLDQAEREKDLFLKMNLVQIINEERKRQVQTVKDSCPVQTKKGSHVITRRYSKELRDNLVNVNKFHDQLIRQTQDVFDKLHGTRQRPAVDVPEYMCCKITLSLMEDPVMTPSGVTYERRVILEHLSRGNYFDPSTREPLTEKDLVPNLALREAIEEFVSKNEWDYFLDDVPLLV